MDVWGLFNGLVFRLNRLLSSLFILPSMRKRLKVDDITLICNNCNAGFIYSDLNLKFCSPTINMFFYSDHFITFCERLDEYLKEPLVLCKCPEYRQDLNYPICNIGDGETLPKLELHFLHYKSFKEVCDSWERRLCRINHSRIFVIWTFFDETNEEWLARLDALPQKNKVAFCNKYFPDYKSAYYIKGYEKSGLGVLSRFKGLTGHRIMDEFDFVSWFNNTEANDS